jgi:hypothetical protein
MQLKKIAHRSTTYENDPHYISHTAKESFFALKISMNLIFSCFRSAIANAMFQQRWPRFPKISLFNFVELKAAVRMILLPQPYL